MTPCRDVYCSDCALFSMQLMQQHACRRKQRQMQARLEELGTESLEERLQMATQMPSPTPYRLSTLIQVGLPASGC